MANKMPRDGAIIFSDLIGYVHCPKCSRCVFRRVTLGQKRTSRWLFDHLAGPERLAQHGTVAIESTKTANMAFLPLSHQDIYCHFTCDDDAGPLQWTCAQSPFSSLQA
jgi:hypothetical protein